MRGLRFVVYNVCLRSINVPCVAQYVRLSTNVLMLFLHVMYVICKAWSFLPKFLNVKSLTLFKNWTYCIGSGLHPNVARLSCVSLVYLNHAFDFISNLTTQFIMSMNTEAICRLVPPTKNFPVNRPTTVMTRTSKFKRKAQGMTEGLKNKTLKRMEAENETTPLLENHPRNTNIPSSLAPKALAGYLDFVKQYIYHFIITKNC